ncbi:MAG: Glutamate/gamma-aminobutyrate antiporter [Candidatus Anoxychlamydiales bacterium]|nr:Glutamate/gamma-aminobutyrate antiporter [Candidatus Anoxychlamydiales bacterium]
MAMKPKVMNLFTLMWVSAAFNISIRNLGIFATTGMQMVFFALITLVIFYVPIALVTAELSTTFPKMGGIAVWVKEAFGKKIGLLAIWLQWIYMNIAMIAMLYFISASLSFIFAPELVHNKVYLISMNVFLIWLFTYFNLKGLKVSTKISMSFFIAGILIPAIFIIILGLIYLFQHKPIQIDTTFSPKNYLPDFHFASFVILIGFMRAFGGIEGSAVHANSVDNPKKNYPIAIFFAVSLGFLINVLGSMALAFVIPQKDISLIGGVMSAFSIYFTKYNLKFLIPVLGFFVAVGQMGGFSTWLAGPVKGLLQTAKEGELPHFFQKVNKQNMPSNLMLIQAIIISVTSSIFLLVSSSINMSFWISVALSMMIYVSMYFLMILSCLYLRYKKPHIQRVFKIPYKNIGVWIVAIIGMMTMVFAFSMALIPPSQLGKENITKYFLILSISIVVVFIIPFIIHRLKKPSWNILNK